MSKPSYYLEDLHVGQRFKSGTHRLDAAQIKAFATQYDPQPFHMDEKPLGSEIARLRDLHIEALRVRWRMIFRRDAPLHLPRHLLFAMIAYRLQAEVMGDLDPETLRFLKQIDLASSKQAAIPLTQAFDQRQRALSAGTVLTREWNGHNHQVTVVCEGFSCEGQMYKSLSEIAKAITGTKWNGPRFFGLRDKKSKEASH